MRDDTDGGEFLQAVWAGLSAMPKALSPKWFYDAEGSRLFEAITQTPEYYPTRTETALLRRIAPELKKAVDAGSVLIEFGSGSATKTRILLEALPDLAAYAPIDISDTALQASAEDLRRDYPELQVCPLLADFTQAVALPPGLPDGPRLGFFPGSTIGNFSPGEARAFLIRARTLLGPGSAFVVGFDVVKSPEVLEAAYDDSAGVTAAFNKNLLRRMSRELGADIDPDAFRHEARWNTALQRVEAHLVSERDQILRIRGRTFAMASGESIHTENAHKFTREGIQTLAEASGWALETLWVSPEPEFAVALLRA